MENARKVFGFDESYFTLTVDNPDLNFSRNSYWETLTKDIIDNYYSTCPIERRKELEVTEQVKYAPLNVSLADIAVSINHLLVWKDVVKKKYENILVLEDDIIFFKESFTKLSENILSDLPPDFDIISLEDGALMHADMYGHHILPQKYLYKIAEGRMRCTGAYIITQKACKTICHLHSKKKWTLEIDHVIDLYGKLGLLNIYWAEPCLFTQGSQKGYYKSGVQSKDVKNKNITNI
jgi:GR25 family glycosyltransferase involved in LPS biosynthesis